MKNLRFRIALAALGACFFALSLAQPAGAFIRLTRQQTSPFVGPVVQAHWLNGTLPLLSVINPATPDMAPALALASVQASAETWENVNTSYFTVNPVDVASGPYLPATLNAGDGQNSMFFDNVYANFVQNSGVIAFVRSVIDVTDGHTIDADMVFNDGDFYTGAGAPPPPQQVVDLQSVVTHEYGHYFGLDHTSVGASTMIPFIIAGTAQRTLELDDRAGISTIYPEPGPGGLSPGGVDFGATTGTISGTVLSGYNGSAVFGAHVEAINLAAPVTANTISAISGELTLRNGSGDFTIHGLPPGNYAVRIVPLDGSHTIAADVNVGGVFNGLDINFEPEFWNDAGETGNGFTDPAGSFVPVAVAAGANSGGIAFITNTFPGQVEIAQYGAFENFVTGRTAAGFRAVRFDPPFDPPYTITKVAFPTFTFGGLPGSYVSGRLCGMNPATGLPDLTNTLFTVAPLPVSANGLNEVPINLTVNTAGQTFFWLLENAARVGTPPNFPFLFLDLTNLDRGLFANSFDLNLAATGINYADRNIGISMFCQMSSPSATPIVGSRNLGANRRPTKMEFDYTNPGDMRADGFPMPPNSLDHVELIRRTPAYVTEGSGGSGSSQISLNSIPAGVQIWSSQAVDKNGHRSVQSAVTVTGLTEDADEPNGRSNEATPLTPPVVNRPELYSPAGDLDYYSLSAKVGETIVASASATGQDGLNNLDLVMVVFDQTNDIVALDLNSGGNLNPALSFTVPPLNNNSSGNGPRKFSILVTDIRGPLFSPPGPPQVITPAGSYRLDVSVTPAVAARSLAARMGRDGDVDGFMFRNAGPNPANPNSKLAYVLPRSVGAGVPVHLRIYDVSGRLVRTLVNEVQAAGPHAAIWDGKDSDGRGVGSGTYFARIDAGEWKHEARLSILK